MVKRPFEDGECSRGADSSSTLRGRGIEVEVKTDREEVEVETDRGRPIGKTVVLY